MQKIVSPILVPIEILPLMSVGTTMWKQQEPPPDHEPKHSRCFLSRQKLLVLFRGSWNKGKSDAAQNFDLKCFDVNDSRRTKHLHFCTHKHTAHRNTHTQTQTETNTDKNKHTDAQKQHTHTQTQRHTDSHTETTTRTHTQAGTTRQQRHTDTPDTQRNQTLKGTAQTGRVDEKNGH